MALSSDTRYIVTSEMRWHEDKGPRCHECDGLLEQRAPKRCGFNHADALKAYQARPIPVRVAKPELPKQTVIDRHRLAQVVEEALREEPLTTTYDDNTTADTLWQRGLSHTKTSDTRTFRLAFATEYATQWLARYVKHRPNRSWAGPTPATTVVVDVAMPAKTFKRIAPTPT